MTIGIDSKYSISLRTFLTKRQQVIICENQEKFNLRDYANYLKMYVIHLSNNTLIDNLSPSMRFYGYVDTRLLIRFNKKVECQEQKTKKKKNDRFFGYCEEKLEYYVKVNNQILKVQYIKEI